MRLLIDNNLSPRLARLLVEAGHDAVHVRDRVDPSSDDEVVFEVAAREARVLVAIDTDFGAILAARRVTRPSFVLIRQSDRTTEGVLAALTSNLPPLAAELQAGAIVTIEDQRVRVRALPLF